MRTVVTRVLLIFGLLSTALCASPLAAQAAPPTRIVYQIEEVVCTAVSQDVEITVGVRSEGLGTFSGVQLSVASTGETIGGRRGAPGDWDNGTFRASIEVLDLHDNPAGGVYFSGNYSPAGDPQLTRNVFTVGNRRFVEEQIETLLGISDLTLEYDDNDDVPGDVTFSDLTCEGSLVDRSLFFTNPATLVQFGTNVFFDTHDCTTSNVAEFTLEGTEGTVDELFVDVTYADRPEAQASGLVIAHGGSWQGEFRLQVFDEPAGTVEANATLEPGRPYHATEGETGMRNHFQVTPYGFTLVIDGPSAPAMLECTLFAVRHKMHTPNPFA